MIAHQHEGHVHRLRRLGDGKVETRETAIVACQSRTARSGVSRRLPPLQQLARPVLVGRSAIRAEASMNISRPLPGCRGTPCRPARPCQDYPGRAAQGKSRRRGRSRRAYPAGARAHARRRFSLSLSSRPCGRARSVSEFLIWKGVASPCGFGLRIPTYLQAPLKARGQDFNDLRGLRRGAAPPASNGAHQVMRPNPANWKAPAATGDQAGVVA